MSAMENAHAMLTIAARALGAELLAKVAFVGGCTTGIHVTDEFSRQGIRFTDDVDLIVHVIGKAGWYQFQEELRSLGFTESMDDDVNCRMRVGDLKVDFMPDDEDILGFSNRWYTQALESAHAYPLSKEINIRVVSPVYFLATKLEAYKGRGKGDPISSHDMEDILTMIDGRAELIAEIAASPVELRTYLSKEFGDLLSIAAFEYAVLSAAGNVKDREVILFDRIQSIIG